MVADGLTALIGNAIWSQGGRTPQLPETAQFREITLPFASEIGAVPIIGPIYQGLISDHDLIGYIAFAMVPITYWALYSTRFGLRLRAVGENPAAVDTAGISVRGLRYSAVVICGVLVGLAGVYLALGQTGYFQPHMSAGRGFIALAALVFAKWRPWPALATCLLFGFLDAVAIRLQGIELPVIGPVPVQAIEALPYILTVVLLAGFIGKAIPPQGVGDSLCQRALRRRLANCSPPQKPRRPTPMRPIRAFKVGAALRTPDGAVFAGCNVENAAYPQGSCAEAGAIAAMALAGGRRIAEIVVVGDGEALCTPCGGCRQRIREFADASTRCIWPGRKACAATFTFAELLPEVVWAGSSGASESDRLAQAQKLQGWRSPALALFASVRAPENFHRPALGW